VSPENPAVVIDNRVMVPRAALDQTGYRTWVKSDEYPDRVRTAFVCGEVLVEMTPESIHKHNQVKAALTEALRAFVRERDLGVVYPDRLLVTNEEAGLSCEPDLTFVCWASFQAGRVRLIERVDGGDDIELAGSPDLVVEIVSDSSVRKDTRLLPATYFSAGILEYWLIDARGEQIQFEILRRGPRGFSAAEPATRPQPSDVLSGRWELTRARNRVGLFTYTLARAAE
jgi:Uma2 family endonuclease